MCLISRPGKLSDSIVGVFQNGGRRYLAYQNTAQNGNGGGHGAPIRRSPPGRRSVTRGGSLGMIAPRRPSNWTFEEAEEPTVKVVGNAMILPIPDSLANIEVLKTDSCPNFMGDIRRALTPVSRGGLRRGKGPMLGADSAVRIVQSGIYTVVMSESAAAIAKALRGGAVAAQKRPQIDQDLLNAFEEWYPGWSLAVCCFSNTEAKRGNPLLFSYEPTKQDDPDMFFIPTLDGHTGKRPSLTEQVDVDHTLFVGTDEFDIPGASSVNYTDADIAPGIDAVLPQLVFGKTVKGDFRNGDVVLRLSDLKKGVFKGLRALPPGADPVGGKAVYV